MAHSKHSWRAEDVAGLDGLEPPTLQGPNGGDGDSHPRRRARQFRKMDLISVRQKRMNSKMLNANPSISRMVEWSLLTNSGPSISRTISP